MMHPCFDNSATLRPSALLYYPALFFSPWLVLGIQVGSLSLYLPFIFAAMDITFLYKLVRQLSRVKLTYRVWAVIGILLALFFSWAFRSREVEKAALKVLLSSYLVTYFYAGFRSYRATKYLVISLFLVAVLSISQFIEANFFWPSNLFDVTTWRHRITEGIVLGLGSDLGASYAPHLLKNMVRISGSAGEPGYFQGVVLTLGAIAIWWRKNWGWRIPVSLTIALLLFLSLSKIGLVILLALIGYIFLRYLTLEWLAVPMVGIVYIACGIYLFSAFSHDSLLTYNASVFERFNGLRLFTMLDGLSQFIGVGFHGICDYLPDSALHVNENHAIWIRDAGGNTLCSVGQASFWGSMLLECGILGTSLILFLLCRAIKVAGHPQISLGILCGILSLQSVHFATSYPSTLALFGFCIANTMAEHSKRKVYGPI